MDAGLVLLAVLLLVSSPILGQPSKISEADFTSSKECGECHQEIYSQWSQSMHSRSLSDPVYQTVINEMVKQTGGAKKVFCLSCHAPVASVAGKLRGLPAPIDWEGFSPIAKEGVTCDFCHTISGNENLGKNISVGAYVYPRKGTTDVKYGRHPDTDNTSHRTEVSKFLTSAEFCGVCHKFMHPFEGREVQSTYQEWLRGPYSKQGVRCQDCHMPAYAGTTVEGGKPREEIHAHLFFGGHSSMVQNAATVSVWGVNRKEEGGLRLSVTTSVLNSGAGHAIPTGVPGIREMWLRVKVLGPDGEELHQKRFWYGQKLVDKEGNDALPWEAFRIVAENRIEPEQSKQTTFQVTLPTGLKGPVKLEAHLFMHLISEAVGRRLQIAVPDPVLMTSAEATVPLLSMATGVSSSSGTTTLTQINP